MPVRSLNSSVLKWPDKTSIDKAVRSWAEKEGARHGRLLRLGYFGSYARDDWGVGSDLDLIAIVERSEDPFHRRAVSWDLADLPVPAELMVYTSAEWDRLAKENGRFARTIARETVWVVER